MKLKKNGEKPMGKIEIKQGMNCKATQGMEGHYIFAKTVTRTHLEAALLALCSLAKQNQVTSRECH